MRDLGTLPGDAASEAFAINNSGDIVGYSSGPSGIRAVVWRDGGQLIQPLGSLGGGGADYTLAHAINNRGDIVGVSRTAQGTRAFSWTARFGMQDLGTLPGDDSSAAVSVNDAGQIVGYSTGRSGSRAVIWTGNAIRSLGTLPGGGFSRALAINNQGSVVGTSSSSSGNRGFLWTPGRGMVDLNGVAPAIPNHVITQVQTINDAGVLVATSGGGQPKHGEGEHGGDEHGVDQHDDHSYHIFLLSPKR
jgi:probable HAF family extracellular repeat protein